MSLQSSAKQVKQSTSRSQSPKGLAQGAHLGYKLPTITITTTITIAIK